MLGIEKRQEIRLIVFLMDWILSIILPHILVGWIALSHLEIVYISKQIFKPYPN